jgi:hypothetical protein
MPLHFIVQYCNDPRPPRQAESTTASADNLDNPHITAVHNLIEPGTSVPEAIRAHPKYREHPLPRWMTYRDAFDFANATSPARSSSIANLDIFLDPSSPWDQVGQILEAGIVLVPIAHRVCAGRRAVQGPGLSQMAFANSQDAWIFRCAAGSVPDCEFEIGELGCDNAIASGSAGRPDAGEPGRSVPDLPLRPRAREEFLEPSGSPRRRPAHRPRRHPERSVSISSRTWTSSIAMDEFLNALKVSDLQRYQIICDVLSHFVKID